MSPSAAGGARLRGYRSRRTQQPSMSIDTGGSQFGSHPFHPAHGGRHRLRHPDVSDPHPRIETQESRRVEVVRARDEVTEWGCASRCRGRPTRADGPPINLVANSIDESCHRPELRWGASAIDHTTPSSSAPQDEFVRWHVRPRWRVLPLEVGKAESQDDPNEVVEAVGIERPVVSTDALDELMSDIRRPPRPRESDSVDRAPLEAGPRGRRLTAVMAPASSVSRGRLSPVGRATSRRGPVAAPSSPAARCWRRALRSSSIGVTM